MYAVDNYLILARWMKAKFALCLFEDQVGGGGQGNSEARGGETSGMWRATVGGPLPATTYGSNHCGYRSQKHTL